MPEFYPLPGDFSPIGRFQRLALLNEASAFNLFTPDTKKVKTSYSPYQGLTPGKPELIDLANIISKAGDAFTLTSTLPRCLSDLNTTFWSSHCLLALSPTRFQCFVDVIKYPRR